MGKIRDPDELMHEYRHQRKYYYNNSQLITCECGAVLRKANMRFHLQRAIKHKLYMEIKELQEHKQKENQLSDDESDDGIYSN